VQQILEDVACNLCGSKDTRVVYPARYDLQQVADLQDKFKSSGDERLIDRVVQCKRCGLRYVNPRMNISRVVKGYSEGTDERFVSQAAGRERTFARQLKFISKYVRKGRVLDIGTAGGSFLAVAKRQGWQVEGIEPNRWLCKWALEHYSIPVRPGVLEDYRFPSNSFDMVTLWDVLEHTGDPGSVLTECQRILKPGGLLVLNVPDIDSLMHKAMGRRWFFYLSVHLYYFSKRTVRLILRKNGLTPILLKPHIQSLEFGYLLLRMEAYSKLLSKLGLAVAKPLGLARLQIPYWLGQTLVLARKPVQQ